MREDRRYHRVTDVFSGKVCEVKGNLENKGFEVEEIGPEYLRAMRVMYVYRRLMERRAGKDSH